MVTVDPVYALDDPRPIAAENPYTYYLPSQPELEALLPGDLVQLVFRPTDGGRKWGAERMWVQIERIEGDSLSGTLESEPEDMPGLLKGELVEFRRYHVIDCVWSEERAVDPPPRPPARRGYVERCLVDRCVTEDRVSVHYLYREEPEPLSHDDRPDSGWRIRGDYRGVSDAELDNREVEFVAIARVLNADDTWIHLVDAPIGSAFIRDWQTGEFVPEAREY